MEFIYPRKSRFHPGHLALVLATVVGLWMAGSVGGQSPPPAAFAYESLAAIRTAESPRKNETFRVEAVVLGINSDAELIHVQDGPHAATIRINRFVGRPPIGSRAEISGYINPNRHAIGTARSIRVIAEEVDLPDPISVSVQEVLAGKAPIGPQVRVSGMIEALRSNRELTRRQRVFVFVRDGGEPLIVDAPKDIPPVEGFQLSTVDLVGVLVPARETGQAPRLWLEDWQLVRFLKPGPADPFAIPVTPPELLDFSRPPISPVRVRGRVETVSDENRFVLHGLPESSARLEIQIRQPWAVRPSEALDLLGYPIIRESRKLFDAVQLARLAAPHGDRGENETGAVSSLVRAATSPHQVRSLLPAKIGQGWPVNLQAFVTHRDEEAQEFYVWYQTGLRVHWQGTNDLPPINSRIYLQGHVVAGIRQPEIVAHEYRVLSTDRDLPAFLTTSASFLSGQTAANPTIMRGVVRAIKPLNSNRAALSVKVQRDLVKAEVQLGPRACPYDLEDAMVEMRGVSAVRGTDGPRWEAVLLIQSPTDITVLEAPPADPFALPRWEIDKILNESWTKPRLHRLHTSGTVTFVDRRRVYVDDGTGGIAADLAGDETVQPGDVVALAGFPTPAMPGPVLENALLRKEWTGTLPDPVVRSAEEVLRHQITARRLKIRGTVSGFSATEHKRLELRDGAISFGLNLPADTTSEQLARWPVGSVVEASGLCVLQVFNDSDPGSFRIHVSGVDDISIISRPPWWTAERAGMAIALLALVSLATLGWAAYFRRRAFQNREQFLRTFQAGGLPAWIVEANSLRCVQINTAARKLFGLDQDCIGKPLAELPLWPSEDDYALVERQLANNPHCRAVELRLQKGDEILHVLFSSEPIGENRLLLSAYDLTERMNLLAELRQAQKMEAVGQLAAGVAHDFNNLLTVIRANSSLTLMTRNLDPDIRELSEEIDQASQRAAELTGQLLAFSRRSVLRPTPADLNAVVLSAHRMLKRVLGETIELQLDCTREPLNTVIDRGMIEQVLLNLGVNARDAMPDGGTFKLATRRISYSPENLPRHPDAAAGDFAIIEALDTGKGMSRDVLARIFEPFFTTKEVGKGSGLGLSTAYGILRQHGGWIQAASSPGAGTRFLVHLPINEANAPKPSGETRSEDSLRGTETILLVDDKADIRRITKRTLEHHGYRVYVAENGPHALEVWREHQPKIDLLLTDLVMPNGMSGFELARRLQKTREALKVVYMTGYSQDLLDYGSQLETGLNFIAKPFVPRDLVLLIRRRLDSDRQISVVPEEPVH